MRAKKAAAARGAAGLCEVRARPGVGDAPDGRTPRVRERGGRTGVGLGRGNWAARGDSARGRKKKKKERLGRFGLRGKEEKENRGIGLG